MKTRLRETHSQSEAQTLHIPKKLREDIENKGFHLYKWISPDEVKLSIQRDFLKALEAIGIPLAVISVLAWLISWLSIIVFFGVIFIWIFFLFLYLLYLSLRRSLLLSKSAFVVMTDSSISLWGKIVKLSDIGGIKKDIDTVWEVFQEDLFWESWLWDTNKSLSKALIKQIFWWYEAIFSNTGRFNFGRNNDDIRLILLLIWLYTLYIVLMASVYFVWVFFLLIFWNILTWCNTKYLLWRWHKVLEINGLFWKLDLSSENIKQEKSSLEHHLEKALKNEWQDWLLLEINAGIKNINSHASQAVTQVWKLKDTIESSSYKEMFSFEVYGKWIKKQITVPLEKIEDLLLQNKILLINTRNSIDKQIEDTSKIELKAPLELQKKRIEMQLESIETFLPQIHESIEKLS